MQNWEFLAGLTAAAMTVTVWAKGPTPEPPAAPKPPSALRCTLFSQKKSYRTDEALQLRVMVTNASKKPQKYDHPDLALPGGVLGLKCVDSRGKESSLWLPQVEGLPGGDFRTLAAGKSVEFPLRVKHGLKPGKYRVRAEYHRNPLGSAATGGAGIPSELLRSNFVDVEVTERPVALAREHVKKLGLKHLDLTSGKIASETEGCWDVEFTDPEAKAAGEDPHHLLFSVDKKTGAVTVAPVY